MAESGSNLQILKAGMKKFAKMMKESSLIQGKWTADSIRIENQRHEGLVVKILELSNIETQIELMTIIKLQRMFGYLANIDAVFKDPMLTQFSLKKPFNELMVCVGDTMIYELYVKVLNFAGTIYTLLSNHEAALRIYKILKIVADLFNDLQTLQSAYLQLGESAKASGDYRSAQEYYEKFLHMSWFLKDLKSETKAYDRIGLALYYQGDLEKAHRYHTRSLVSSSALESPIMKGIVDSKLKDEMNRKARMFSLKDAYFKFEVARELMDIEGNIEEFLTLRDVNVCLWSNFAVDNLAALGPSSFSNNAGKRKAGEKVNPKLVIKNDHKYTADFTPEGYTLAMMRSNPAKFSLILEGAIRLDDSNLKNVNLYDPTYDTVDDPHFLSHLSQNNSKIAFSPHLKGPEICIKYLRKEANSKVKQAIEDLKSEFLEFIECAIKEIAAPLPSSPSPLRSFRK